MTFNLKALLLIITFNLTASCLWSQVLWPGDVNNNGVVNHVDWLYIGYVIGEVGPPRDIGEQGIEWEAKTFNPWGTDFMGTSIDYAYADCNGDGIIDGADLNAVEINYLNEHGTVTQDMPPPGDAGVDPSFMLESVTVDPFPIGGVMLFNINLGTEAIPVESFSGVAFSITYDPNVVLDMSIFPAEEGDWFEAGLLMVQNDDPVEGRIDFAFTALNDVNPLEDLSGLFAGLFIVIEDDVVGMQDPEIETTFTIDNILLLGDQFESSPVVNDTTSVTIFSIPTSNNDLINEEQIEVYPNPASDFIYLKTDLQIERVELFNSLGQGIRSFESNSINPYQLNVANTGTGVYLIKIYTEQGVLTKKIILQ